MTELTGKELFYRILAKAIYGPEPPTERQIEITKIELKAWVQRQRELRAPRQGQLPRLP